MASDGWRSDRPLKQQMAQEASRFNFYQLIRLLLIERELDADQLDRAVRFQADLGQAFPAHEIHAVRLDAATPSGGPAVAVVETANYALAGYLGPLPEALVDQMLARYRDGDVAWVRFLDMFNHRLNALRFQLKSMPRLALNLLPLTPEALERTPVARMLLSLIGLAEPELGKQLQLPVRSVLGLAGLLADRRRSIPLVTRVLSRFVGAAVTLSPFAGAWRPLSEGARTRLGRHGQGRNLGQSARLGRQAWLPSAAIGLSVGPLPYATYCRLLPKRQGGEDDLYPRFSWLVRFLLDRRQDAWVQLRLAAAETPSAALSAQGRRITGQGVEYGLRLGQTAWLQGGGRDRQATFLVRSFETEAA